jgi:hypothetical protein
MKSFFRSRKVIALLATTWYDAPVTWTASGTDATSGIVSCQSLAYSGTDTSGVQVSRSCTDAAGNTGVGLSPPFKYDATKPALRAAIVNTTASLRRGTGAASPSAEPPARAPRRSPSRRSTRRTTASR